MPQADYLNGDMCAHWQLGKGKKQVSGAKVCCIIVSTNLSLSYVYDGDKISQNVATVSRFSSIIDKKKICICSQFHFNLQHIYCYAVWLFEISSIYNKADVL